MKLKALPSDFNVEELYSPELFSEEGRWRVYLLTKQSYNTMDTLRVIAKTCKVPLKQISYAGLKDRQAVTKQLIAVEGRDISFSSPGIKLQYVGRVGHPLSGKDIRGNLFRIVLRGIPMSCTEAFEDACNGVSRYGLVNYFDSQRFGCLRCGQGFAMKYIISGQYARAFRIIVSSFSPEGADASRVKRTIQDNWGNWNYLSGVLRMHHYGNSFRHLARKPEDFKGALGLLPEFERTLHLFAYQSFLWNRAVANFLEHKISGEKLVSVDYVAGKLLFYRNPEETQLEEFKNMDFPLAGHSLDEFPVEIRNSYESVLEAEGISLSQLGAKIPGFYLKEEKRSIVVFPENMNLEEISPDELSAGGGMMKAVVSFELPRGAYATLVMGRISDAVTASRHDA